LGSGATKGVYRNRGRRAQTPSGWGKPPLRAYSSAQAFRKPANLFFTTSGLIIA